MKIHEMQMAKNKKKAVSITRSVTGNLIVYAINRKSIFWSHVLADLTIEVLPTRAPVAALNVARRTTWLHLDLATLCSGRLLSLINSRTAPFVSPPVVNSIKTSRPWCRATSPLTSMAGSPAVVALASIQRSSAYPRRSPAPTASCNLFKRSLKTNRFTSALTWSLSSTLPQQPLLPP